MTIHYLNGKSEALSYLKKFQLKHNFIIPDFIIVQKKDIKKNKKKIIEKIFKFSKNKPIILRSSSSDEDKKSFSNAGKFNSYLIKKLTKENIEKNLSRIYSEMIGKYNKIIIQKLIINPDISGVIFTRGMNNNSPYYSINYTTDKRTDIITSGKNNKIIKNQIIFNNSPLKSKFANIINVLEKIKKITKLDRLDIEFALKKKKIFIFQVRTLKKIKYNINFDKKVYGALVNIKKKISYFLKENPNLYGKTTAFSNMSDWNPAEMIGVKPTPMALSLYSELITDEIWAQQRLRYGYKDVRPNPLMINFLGMPYIDLRTDFNSFLPKNLNESISKKVIDNAIKKLKKKPYLHDKIEFELFETCYDFNSKNRINFLNYKDKRQYLDSLLILTNNILSGKLMNDDVKLLNKLDSKILNLKKKKLSPIQEIYFLTHYCKIYGTLPFAGLARCAFVSTRLIKTLNEKRIITQDDVENFYKSINNVSTQINNDLFKNKKKITNFLKKYGHLRPASYSISSKNYSENYNQYFNVSKIKLKKIKSFKFSKIQKLKIENLFKTYKLNINYKNFIKFVKKSIYYREYAKFKFTICINLIFENLIKLGKEINIERKDFEMLSIKEIIKHYNNLDIEKLKLGLNKNIKENKLNFATMKYLDNPDLILNNKNFYEFQRISSRGNYITKADVNGEIYELSLKSKNYDMLNNKIVLIEKADPGYDFIFSYNIKALITKYGGANSHMAIRCLENKVPAIIGIGANEYRKISNCKTLNINCFQRNYSTIS
jgi:glutamine kinase